MINDKSYTNIGFFFLDAVLWLCFEAIKDVTKAMKIVRKPIKDFIIIIKKTNEAAEFNQL